MKAESPCNIFLDGSRVSRDMVDYFSSKPASRECSSDGESKLVESEGIREGSGISGELLVVIECGKKCQFLWRCLCRSRLGELVDSRTESAMLFGNPLESARLGHVGKYGIIAVRLVVGTQFPDHGVHKRGLDRIEKLLIPKIVRPVVHEHTAVWWGGGLVPRACHDDYYGNRMLLVESFQFLEGAIVGLVDC